jgi:hypothetical protein
MATTWQALESQVLTLLNAQEAVSVSGVETIYQATAAKTDADIGDQVFFLSRIRDAIVDAHQQVIRFICLTEGHPRRGAFRSVVSVAHRDALPDALAYGAFYYSTNELTERAAEEVDAIRRDTASLNGVEVYYYAKSGNVLLATVTPVDVEIFDYDRPVSHPSALSTLFESDTNEIAAPDEFVPAIVHMASGHLALTAGSMQDQSAQHFALAVQSLKGIGIRVETADFGDVRPAQKAAEGNA